MWEICWAHSCIVFLILKESYRSHGLLNTSSWLLCLLLFPSFACYWCHNRRCRRKQHYERLENTADLTPTLKANFIDRRTGNNETKTLSVILSLPPQLIMGYTPFANPFIWQHSTQHFCAKQGKKSTSQGCAFEPRPNDSSKYTINLTFCFELL